MLFRRDNSGGVAKYRLFFQAIFFLVNHSSFFIRSIFDEVSTMDVVIEKIMVGIVLQGQLTGINFWLTIYSFLKTVSFWQAFAKRLVNADRCALFMLDSKTEELYANLFDEGDEDGSEYKFRNGVEIR